MAFNEITRAISAELRPFGLTHAQFQVLLHARGQPGLMQKDLSERLNVTTSNVSMLVSRLEEAGLLTRVPDGAAYHLELTGAGHRLFEDLGPVRERFITGLFAELSVDEIRSTADILHRFRHQ